LFLVKEQYAELRRTLEELREAKAAFEAQLQSIPGIRVYPAAANFLLVELVDHSLEANELYQQLGRRGVLVRVCDSFRGLAKGRFIRVAVRTRPENERLVAELSAICGKLLRSVA
jgi:threonine-phosphate decarboxylase